MRRNGTRHSSVGALSQMTQWPEHFGRERLIQYWFYVVAAVVVLVICAGVVSTSMRPQCHDRLEKTLEHYLLTKWAVCISFAAHTGFLWFIPHEVLRNVVGLLPDLLQVFSEYLLYSIWAEQNLPASPQIPRIIWELSGFIVDLPQKSFHPTNCPCPEVCFKTVYTSWRRLGAVPLALFWLAMWRLLQWCCLLDLVQLVVWTQATPWRWALAHPVWVLLLKSMFFPESVWAQGSSNSGGLYLIFSSSHLLIFTSSSHLLIFTSSHLHIFSSSHLLIFTSSSHLLIFTSSHLHIFSSSHLLIFASSHLHVFSSSHFLIIFTSSHLHIFSSSHLLIFSSSHLLIFTSSHLHIFISSSHLHIFSSSHLLIFTSSHLHIFISSSHLHIFSSSHLLILTSSHLRIFSSSRLLILTSSHLHILTSSHVLLLPSCPHIFTSSPLVLLPSPSFLFLFWRRGQGAVPTRRHETQPFRTKWGSIAENWGKIAICKSSRANFSHEMRFDRQKLR